MNWYLWFLTIVNMLGALVYFTYAVKGKSIDWSNTNPIAMVLWAIAGVVILFWTSGPLNTFGILYVAYSAASTVFFFINSHKKLSFNPWICALFGIICSIWPILILTVGFSL